MEAESPVVTDRKHMFYELLKGRYLTEHMATFRVWGVLVELWSERSKERVEFDNRVIFDRLADGATDLEEITAKKVKELIG